MKPMQLFNAPLLLKMLSEYGAHAPVSGCTLVAVALSASHVPPDEVIEARKLATSKTKVYGALLIAVAVQVEL
eukprot:IDg3957t1